MKQKFNKVQSALMFLMVLGIASCVSNPPVDGETILCKGKCIVVFRPDSVTVKRYLSEENDMTFVETMSDHEHYAEALGQKLKNTDIQFSQSTARFITIDNGNKKERFEARDKDGYPFGVILSRPDGVPMVHYGIFTDVEYNEMINTYFKD